MIETEGHTTHERLSDWDILDQYNSLYDSDPSAANKFFAELYNRHSTYVHGIALRIVKDTHTADDIVMTTFTRLFRHRERLDSQRASNLKPLLKTIASRLAINSLRGKKRLAENSLTTAEGGENAVEDTSPDPYENLERSGDIIIIRRALARIGNYANRETFRLAKIKELSYKEIADHSNVPIGTVMSRCHWGRKSFTENMAAYYTASEFEGSDTEMLAIIAAEHPNRMRSAIAAIPGEKRQHMLRRSIMEGARNIEISTEMDTERQTFNSQLRKAKLLLGAEIRLEPKYRNGKLEIIDRTKEQDPDLLIAVVDQISSDEQRLIVELVEVREKSLSEVEEVTGLTRQQIDRRLFKGRAVVVDALRGNIKRRQGDLGIIDDLKYRVPDRFSDLISQIPNPNERKAVRMKEVDRITYNDIASEFQITFNQAVTLVNRGRKELLALARKETIERKPAEFIQLALFDDRSRVVAAIQEVESVRMQEALRLNHLDGKSTAAIAEHLGITSEQVSQALKKGRRKLVELLHAETQPYSSPSELYEALRTKYPHLFEDALSSLQSRKQRQALRLVEYHQWTVQEVAERLSSTPQQVREALYAGRKNINHYILSRTG